MTVSEIFRAADLSPRGPVRWKEQVPESSAGVYVVARVGNPNDGCKPCELPFQDPLPSHLEIDLEFERQRWLASEPVVYIGKTDQTIHKRTGDFYRHKCGKRSPHAGGQVVHLLNCDLWVYWSPSANPYDDELTMLCAFKKQADQIPFANFNGKHGKNGKRIRRSN